MKRRALVYPAFFAGVFSAIQLFAQQADAQTYAISPEYCVGSEGKITIGNGKFSLTDSDYKRISPKRDIGNGWFEAWYYVEVEGNPEGQSLVRMKITPTEVIVKSQGGELDFVSYNCDPPPAQNTVSPIDIHTIKLDQDGGRCDGDFYFIAQDGKLHVRSGLHYFIDSDRAMPISGTLADNKMPGRIQWIAAQHPDAGTVYYAIVDNRSIASFNRMTAIPDPNAVHAEGNLNVMQGFQSCL